MTVIFAKRVNKSMACGSIGQKSLICLKKGIHRVLVEFFYKKKYFCLCTVFLFQ